MQISETAIKFISIIYALLALGAFIVTHTVYKARKKIDETLMKSRVFISKSFIRDLCILLFLACFFFFIHTIMEFNNTFGLYIEESIADLIKEITEFGILIFIVILVYKLFKSINQVEHLK